MHQELFRKSYPFKAYHSSPLFLFGKISIVIDPSQSIESLETSNNVFQRTGLKLPRVLLDDHLLNYFDQSMEFLSKVYKLRLCFILMDLLLVFLYNFIFCIKLTAKYRHAMTLTTRF